MPVEELEAAEPLAEPLAEPEPERVAVPEEPEPEPEAEEPEAEEPEAAAPDPVAEIRTAETMEVVEEPTETTTEVALPAVTLP